ncbi:protein yellow [Nilaparvata lugens]|uniref:protein yellow n=1 Tax=Nilaparvata lugens TaxID=108931 RepID=UPI00193E9A15|nr:protein yellow [Nilaparvata lugens]XP_039289950.1 protein yellow [Nilaparvata lugens]
MTSLATRPLVAAATLLLVWQCSAEIEVVKQWPLLTFDTPFNYPRNEEYTPQRTVFTGFEVGWDKIYLSLPRFQAGAPASLGWVPRKSRSTADQSPPIQAYPSWDWHVDAASGRAREEGYNCTGIMSVFRVRADRCNRLWVLDSGVLDSLSDFYVACPPKLLIFDMRTDELIRSITFPQEVLRRNSLLTNFVLDDQNDDGAGGYGGCDNVFVYMADTTNPAVVVYDSRRDSAWRLSHPLMFPDPDHGTYSLGGESFTLMDGIIGLALSPPGSPNRRLYFQPFASDRLFSLPTSALKAGPNPGDDADLPVALVGHKSSQAAGLAVDPRDGSLIFAPISETALAAWTPGSANHRVLAYDPERLQFLLHITSVDRDSGTIWAISTKLQKFVRQSVNKNEYNLRIMRIIQPHDYVNNTLPLFKRRK